MITAEFEDDSRRSIIVSDGSQEVAMFTYAASDLIGQLAAMLAEADYASKEGPDV